MQSGERLSLEQIRAFLEASEEVEFAGRNREEVYGWVEETLRQQNYGELGRADRGLVRRYLQKMTGLSRAQITRLITQYQQGEPVRPKPYRRRRFATRYTRADIELLAQVDEAHETLSGPATQKILQRECYPHLPAAASGLSTDPAGVGGDRRAATPAAGGAPGISAGGHGTSRGPGRSQRGVSHQRRG
jgi:hypothetical protein